MSRTSAGNFIHTKSGAAEIVSCLNWATELPRKHLVRRAQQANYENVFYMLECGDCACPPQFFHGHPRNRAASKSFHCDGVTSYQSQPNGRSPTGQTGMEGRR